MTSPLEHAAKAAYEAATYRLRGWDMLHPGERESRVEGFKKGLETLREPTDEMLTAGGGDKATLQLVAKGIWQAMLGKVLEG